MNYTQKILRKIKTNGETFNGMFPQCQMTYDGKYVLTKGGNWTDGFYIGIFHLAYLLTNEEEFLHFAERYDKFLELRIQNTRQINEANDFLKLDHDVGFIFLPSVGIRYQCFEKEKDKQILVKAANVLVDRFHKKGGFIRAWDTWPWDTDEQFIREKKGKVIIDSMMNLPLLFQVATYTGEDYYYEIAETHAKTLSQTIIREDGSTFHTYNFDPETGCPIGGKTRQGFSDESCWARGQAWAVYGYALAYKYTKNPLFLKIADKASRFFMEHLSSTDMPCWDFGASQEIFSPWDSSASAICASGLLELWELTDIEIYKQEALRLIKALNTFCLTAEYEQCQAILLHGCVGAAISKGNEGQLQVPYVDQPLVYGDYFYMECLLKLSQCKLRVF